MTTVDLKLGDSREVLKMIVTHDTGGGEAQAEKAAGGATKRPPALAEPFRFVLPYPPSANNFKVPIATRFGVRFVLSKAAREYKARTKKLLQQHTAAPLTGSVALTLNVYRPRAVGDTDNSVKLTQDALTGVAFVDDEQVTQLHVYRHDDKKNPRVEIKVTILSTTRP